MITDLAYPLIVVGGLLLAIRLRRRMGLAARAAIAGFAIRASTYGLGWLLSAASVRWARGTEYDGGPLPGPPPVLVATALVLGVVHAAGIWLLVVAALRGRAATARQHP